MTLSPISASAFWSPSVSTTSPSLMTCFHKPFEMSVKRIRTHHVA